MNCLWPSESFLSAIERLLVEQHMLLSVGAQANKTVKNDLNRTARSRNNSFMLELSSFEDCISDI